MIITFAACRSFAADGWYPQVWIDGRPRAHSYQRDVYDEPEAFRIAREWAVACREWHDKKREGRRVQPTTSTDATPSETKE